MIVSFLIPSYFSFDAWLDLYWACIVDRLKLDLAIAMITYSIGYFLLLNKLVSFARLYIIVSSQNTEQQSSVYRVLKILVYDAFLRINHKDTFAAALIWVLRWRTGTRAFYLDGMPALFLKEIPLTW